MLYSRAAAGVVSSAGAGTARFRARVVSSILSPLEHVKLREGEVLEVTARPLRDDERALDDAVEMMGKVLGEAGDNRCC